MYVTIKSKIKLIILTYFQHPLQCFKVGSLLRSGKGRVVSLFSDITGQIIACHGIDMQIELFYFCTDEETNVRYRSRRKKERRRY